MNTISMKADGKLQRASIFGRVLAYESGELSDDEVAQLFADLIETGIVWELQGHYQRMAEMFLRLWGRER